MFVHKQKYVDYNDVEREETLYFHLNKSELRKLEMSESGGLSSLIERVMETRDQGKLLELFYKIIDLSYGVKDADGRGFHKSKAILEDFQSTEAYSEFAEELLADAKLAAEFVKGVMPKGIAEQVNNIDPAKLTDQQRKVLEKFN